MGDGDTKQRTSKRRPRNRRKRKEEGTNNKKKQNGEKNGSLTKVGARKYRSEKGKKRQTRGKKWSRKRN